MWVRGLKQVGFMEAVRAYEVAPHVGAWIETSTVSIDKLFSSVAPHVGAWIETFDYIFSEQDRKSHPMWVRGLKPLYFEIVVFVELSHPMWVRGLKP